MTTRIHLTIDEKTKEEALEILNQLGLDASTAVNIFFKKVIQTRSIPFDIKAPEHTGGKE